MSYAQGKSKPLESFRSLLRRRNYPEVIRTRRTFNQIQDEEAKQLTEAQEALIEKKLKELKRHQAIAIGALKDKIHAERLNIINKRKEDTECLVIRIRNLRGEIRKKMADEEKRANEQMR